MDENSFSKKIDENDMDAYLDLALSTDSRDVSDALEEASDEK